MPTRINFFIFGFLSSFILQDLGAQEDSNFVNIPAGQYSVGKKGHLQNPVRKVKVNAYSIAARETTNSQFELFVKATGYITDAEKMHNAMVFEPGLKEFRWLKDTTGYWRFPNGKSRGGIGTKMDHPVTSISYADILAYCAWAGCRLPTLDEWEIACRAGTNTDYYWGDDRSLITQYANIWYGRDHLVADSSDGFMYTSPVGSFQPNPWGLYDMYGNVFEFCSGHLLMESSSDKIAHARGGSWWCSKNACNFFNSYDVGKVSVHASFSNQGFRVVK